MQTRAGYLAVGWVLILASSGVGAELPKRKPGLWEMELRPEGTPSAIKATQCIDEKTDAEMLQRAMQGEGAQKCSQAQFQKSASGYETDYNCTTSDGVKMKGHVLVSGDFNSEYTMEQNAHFDPPLHGRSDMHQKAKFHYLGACPSDMQPGEIQVNGVNFNPSAMSKAKVPRTGKLNLEEMKKMLEQMQQQGRP